MSTKRSCRFLNILSLALGYSPNDWFVSAWPDDGIDRACKDSEDKFE